MRRSTRIVAWGMAAMLAAAGCARGADPKERPSQGDTTKLIDTYKDHTDAVLAVAINPANPNEFVTGGRDKSPERDRPMMRVWNFAAGRQAYAINYLYGDPLALSYSSDGRYLLCIQDNYWDKEQGCIRYVARLTIWDARRGRVFKNLDRGEFNAPIACSFSPDVKSLAIAGLGIKIIDVYIMDPDVEKIGLKKQLIGHLAPVLSTAWAADSARIASGSMDGTVRIWNINEIVTPLLKTLVGHSNSVNSVAWSPDSNSIASGSSDKTVRLWDVNSGMLRYTMEGHTEAVTSVAFSPDGRLVFSASMDRTIRVWDVATGGCLQTLTGHDGPVEALAVSSDGKALISVSQDKTVKTWSIGKYPSAGRK